MIQKLSKRVVVATAALIAVSGGSALLTGTALACDHDHGDDHGDSSESDSSANGHDGEDGTASYHEWGNAYYGNGAAGGDGGASNANCAVPVGVSAGVVGQGGDNTQCTATGGAGGDGGSGVDY